MTSTTIGDLLPHLLVDLPSNLVGDGARARLASPGVATLPLLSGMLLECRLGETSATAPVGLALRAAGTSDFAEVERIASTGGEAWQAVAKLLHELRGDHAFHTSFPECWLEFDLDAAPPSESAGLEPPSFFVKVEESIGRPPRLGPLVAPRRKAAVAALQRVLETLGRAEPDMAAGLARVFESMPASTRVSYLGAMLARGGRGCRLTFDRMPLDGGCTAMLRAIGGNADEVRLIAAIEFLSEWTTHAVLHVDLSPTTADETAQLETVFGFELEPALLEIERFRTAMTARGMISTGQLTSLEGWPRRLHRTAADAWPAALAHVTSLSRTINHLKLVVPANADDDWTLKVYLGAQWNDAFPLPSLWK